MLLIQNMTEVHIKFRKQMCKLTNSHCPHSIYSICIFSFLGPGNGSGIAIKLIYFILTSYPELVCHKHYAFGLNALPLRFTWKSLVNIHAVYLSNV